MRTVACCLSAAALVFAAGACDPADAQIRDQIRLFGVVLDDQTAEPIPGATVELLSSRGAGLGRALTNDAGVFRFILPQHAGYRFRASRIGYRRTTSPTLWTEEHDTLHVEIRLDQDAVLLAPLEVTAWSRRVRPSPVTEGFRDRMASGIGYFLTRDDIEDRGPTFVTDMLNGVPGVHLRSSGRGTRRHIYMSRSGDNCPAQIFVDGFLLNGRSRVTGDPDFTLDDAVSPGSVEGIEVYHGLGTMPAQFLNPDSRCGAVIVWTRRGG